MDNPSSVQPSVGSISSKHVSRVFSAQVQVRTPSCQLHVQALLDTGANSCFMDRDFAQKHQISLHTLPCPVSVVVIDGCPIASGKIVEESKLVHILLGDLGCVVSFNRMCSLEHRIVLDLPWFELYNPRIYWRRQEIRCPPKRNIQGLNLGCFS